jgi:hypothetical protein
MTMRDVITAAALLSAGIAPRAAAQHQGAPAPATLVRCGPGLDVPCMQARVPLDTTGAQLLAGFDSAGEATAWAGWIGTTRLVGPGVVVPERVSPPLRLLVLLDRSGSMRGQGIAYTRITLKAFIQSLDSASIRVAVAGFESRNVTAGIADVPFQSPARAADALEALPAPDLAGNTALYAALDAGITRVQRAVSAEPGTRGAILLVTDGRNDVGHPGDDAGLASGVEGLTAVRDAVQRSGQRVWLLGVGPTPAIDELRGLAGASGSVMIASLDPNAMARKLSDISRELHAARLLTFGVPGRASLALGRSAWVGAAAVEEDGKPILLHALQWQPPLFALPAFAGVADSASLPAALAPVLDAGSSAGTPWLMALLFGLVGVAGWVLVPRLLWRQEVVLEAPAPATPKQAAVPSAAATGSGDGMRTGITEAAPRRPDEITAEFQVPPELAGRR